jgi:hypothetical protein
MVITSFDELVKQEQQASNAVLGEQVDLFKERDEWLVRLHDLYLQVEVFLADYVQTGSVKIAYAPVEITEEQVGTYQATSMVVTIGRKTVRLEPIGTFLIATKGRVDVVGPRESGRLTLLDKDVKNLSQLIRVSVSIVGKSAAPPPPPQKDPSSIQWVWRIVGRPPKIDILELTKESFLSLLAEVANG